MTLTIVMPNMHALLQGNQDGQPVFVAQAAPVTVIGRRPEKDDVAFLQEVMAAANI